LAPTGAIDEADYLSLSSKRLVDFIGSDKSFRSSRQTGFAVTNDKLWMFFANFFILSFISSPTYGLETYPFFIFSHIYPASNTPSIPRATSV